MLVRFCAVLLTHLLYDFHWQGPFIAENKGRYDFLLGVHALTDALFAGAALWFLGSVAWWHIPFLFVTHFFCDRWKCQQPKTPELFYLIYIDQGFHLATLIVVSIFS